VIGRRIPRRDATPPAFEKAALDKVEAFA
jgi:hypothetical protein